MPTPPAPNSFEMDGMVHYVGNEGEDCCEGFGVTCHDASVDGPPATSLSAHMPGVAL